MSCDTDGLKSLLGILRGTVSNARAQADALATVAREGRAVATASNAERPNLVTATGEALGIGAAAGSDSARPGASPPSVTPGPAGSAPSMGEMLVQGLRNRLFLKYAGIDYELYNFPDTVYR
jgi:hypothetical protein